VTSFCASLYVHALPHRPSALPLQEVVERRPAAALAEGEAALRDV